MPENKANTGSIIYGGSVSGRSGAIYENGIGSKRNFIPWDVVDAIHLGNRTIRMGGTPVSALYLRAVGRDKTAVTVNQRVNPGRREESDKRFNAMHDYVVTKIIDRQMRDVLALSWKQRSIPFGALMLRRIGYGCTDGQTNCFPMQASSRLTLAMGGLRLGI